MADTKKKLTHSAEEIDEAIEKTKTNEADIAEAKAEIAEHTTNADIHVTAAEKASWNAKADADTVYTKEEVDSLINALTLRIEALEAASAPTEEV